MRTVCRIQIGLDSIAAQAYCEASGMKLFRVTSYDDYVALLQAAFGHFSTNLSGNLHIGGIQSPNGTWFVDGQPLFKQATPKGASGGRYLNVYQFGVTLTFQGGQSSLFSNSYCEFVRASPVKKVPKTNLCRNVTDILDNSNYVKSACIINTVGPESVAQSLCFLSRMNLFQIKFSFEYEALKTFAAGAFTTSQNYYVDGKFFNGTWNVGNGSLFNGAIPASVTGACLIFRTSDTTGAPCSGNNRVICEYDKNTV